MSVSRSQTRRPARAKKSSRASSGKTPSRKSSRRKSSPRKNSAQEDPALEAEKGVPKPPDLLGGVGAYGFEHNATAILASLVTEDPLLLIGPSGTGKTYLLNSISEALGLEHRHYNASLISFDDLVGFPYPDDEHTKIRFLETPATIWGAESVLVDEISRCKPEHQNRLFSLIHERRVQGLPLQALRYRWAAMNPCCGDQNGAETYVGSEPLDPALADRFALIVQVSDWDSLGASDRLRIANPASEGKTANDGGKLHAAVAKWREEFLRLIENCPEAILEYVCTVVTALGEAKIRISPRRARLLARSLVAARVVRGRFDDSTVRLVLEHSIPHQAWGEAVDRIRITAAHKLAWDLHLAGPNKKWLLEFGHKRKLEDKVALLIDCCPDPETGTLAVEQLLARESRERAAAFALAVYPAAAAGKLVLGAEGVNDLGRIAAELLTVNGTMTWQERNSESGTQHPQLAEFARSLDKLEGARLERAQQLFNWCLVNKIALPKPRDFEADFDACVRRVGKCLES